ncbi:alpha/beta hydrolase [Candidatus Avelusimicrobium caledoniensis]|uniref:alpha/beta hydrolase n=1 Tax=Candidatus Avelusimicrobium caledoniensis TaxID=3416220 RepID=UPI003D0B3947
MKRISVLSFFYFLLALPIWADETKGTPVTLSTKDGWALSATYLPAQESKRTVILLHDLNKSKKNFAALENALAQNGIGYLAVDLRGHGASIGGGKASTFAREGVDNPFNKMTRDVDSAIDFLHKKGVKDANLAVLGAGLGASVAAKSMTFWPDTALLALISPTSNVRDVLTIPAMRLYKGNVLIAAGAADKKMFLEASVIRNVAYLTTGTENGKVTFLTAYDKTSHEMLDQYLIPAVIQWLQTPKRPDVMPDADTTVQADTHEQTEGLAVEPSGTEESLVPSVL